MRTASTYSFGDNFLGVKDSPSRYRLKSAGRGLSREVSRESNVPSVRLDGRRQGVGRTKNECGSIVDQ